MPRALHCFESKGYDLRIALRLNRFCHVITYFAYEDGQWLLFAINIRFNMLNCILLLGNYSVPSIGSFVIKSKEQGKLENSSSCNMECSEM